MHQFDLAINIIIPNLLTIAIVTLCILLLSKKRSMNLTKWHKLLLKGLVLITIITPVSTLLFTTGFADKIAEMLYAKNHSLDSYNHSNVLLSYYFVAQIIFRLVRAIGAIQIIIALALALKESRPALTQSNETPPTPPTY